MTPKEAETADTLDRQLHQILACKPSVLVGCIRQNVWSGMEWANSWRAKRGNCLLQLIATKEEVRTPLDNFCIYYTPAFPQNKIDLYHFRAGKRKGWWEKDLALTAALVEKYTSFKVAGSTLLHEVDGELATLYFEYPASSSELVEEAEANYHPNNPGRINKSSGRAAVICRYCSVKSACDQYDLAEGETGDWPEGYLIGKMEEAYVG